LLLHANPFRTAWNGAKLYALLPRFCGHDYYFCRSRPL
jgi:hypothetical protein